MKYSVEHKGHIVGNADLEVTDASMNVLTGQFVVSQKYYEIQHVFQLFADKQYEEYYEARDALGLRLLDSASKHVATSFIHIVDYRAEAGPDAIQLEVQLLTKASNHKDD